MNSPESSMISDTMRRMNALSSTMSTRGLPARLEDTRSFPQGPNFDTTVTHMKKDTPAIVAPRILGDNGYIGVRQRVAHGDDVPLADIDPAGRQEIPEHARAADDLGAHALETCAEPPHFIEQQRNGGAGELGRVRAIARHRLARQQHVRHAAD